MSLEIRCLKAGEYDALADQIMRAFGYDALEDDGVRLRELVAPGRTACAFDGGRMVGTCAAADLQLAVPGGGTVPMAGTTLVSVEPTHRRRGVLRAMMRAHIEQATERGDPMLGLWASEAEIYPRFGFGAAAQGHLVNVDASRARIGSPEPGTSLRRVDGEEALDALSDVYRRTWQGRPGMCGRAAHWWRLHTLHDPPGRRHGGSALRHVVCEHDGGLEGYVTYRQHASEVDFGRGTVNVVELIARTDAAHAALWNFLLHIDLFPKVRYLNSPPDDELQWRVAGSYALQRCFTDNLWLRVLDVPRALCVRRSLTQERLRLRVHDEFGGAASGCFQVEASPSFSECKIVSAEPDIELSVSTLGSLYLGRSCVRQMARAGVIHGTRASLTTLERLFAWTREPWCPEMF